MEMPRTFEKLRELSASADKEAFCNKEMQRWVSAIKKTNGQPFTNVKELYRKALNEPIDIDDIRAATSGKLATLGGADPEEAFIKQMVKTNIFAPRDDGRYELQFDCQHKAVKEVFHLQKPLRGVCNVQTITAQLRYHTDRHLWTAFMKKNGRPFARHLDE